MACISLLHLVFHILDYLVLKKRIVIRGSTRPIGRQGAQMMVGIPLLHFTFSLLHFTFFTFLP
jgi:hypothetical protein